MKGRKILALFIVTVSILTGLFAAVPVEAASLLYYTFEGTLGNWNSSQNAAVTDAEAHTGSGAACLTDTAALVKYTGPGTPSVGTEYMLSVWVKKDAAATVTVTCRFIDAGNKTLLTGADLSASGTGDWEQLKARFTAPEGAYRLQFAVSSKGGTVYVDDAAVFSAWEGENDRRSEAAGTELITNGDFEETPASGSWNGVGVRTDAVAYSGTYSMHISAASGDAVTSTRVLDLEGGARYQASMWLCTDEMPGIILFKTEFYTTNDTSWISGTSYRGYNTHLENFGRTYGNWRQVVRTFTAPPDAKSMQLYIRIFSGGNAWFDMLSVQKIDEPFAGTLRTDRAIYYSDICTGSGNAVFTANTENYPALAGNIVNFALKNPAGTEIYTDSETLSEGEAVFSYPLSLLEEEGEAYTVEATVESSAVVEPVREEIYRYDRPTALDKEGNYLVDGEIFQPVIGYHVGLSGYATCGEVGINVVQNYAVSPDTALAEAEKYGLKVLLVLYTGMKPAGHPENIQGTEKLVRQYMGHKALFGYAIMDEPANYAQDTSEGLMASYKAVRDIDSHHPIWIVDVPNSADDSSRYCDIFAADPYKTEANNGEITAELKKIRAEMPADKPLYALLDAGGVYNMRAALIRNQVYQAFLAGAKAVGYYTGTYTGNAWEGLSQFKEEELSTVQTVGKKAFTEAKDGDVLRREWTENGTSWFLLANLTNETQPISLSLPEGNVYVKGGNVGETIAPLGVLLVRVVPNEKMYFMRENAPTDVLKTGSYTAVYKNDTGKKVQLAVALYSLQNGEAKLLETAFAAGEGDEIRAPLSVSVVTGQPYALRVMVWEQGTLRPVASSAELKK